MDELNNEISEIKSEENSSTENKKEQSNEKNTENEKKIKGKENNKNQIFELILDESEMGKKELKKKCEELK